MGHGASLSFLLSSARGRGWERGLRTLSVTPSPHLSPARGRGIRARGDPMTFSIAGRCARTGMLGAVVTPSAMAVGSRCAWAEAGVGTALTQHRTDPRLGPIILAGMKRGRSTQAEPPALWELDA